MATPAIGASSSIGAPARAAGVDPRTVLLTLLIINFIAMGRGSFTVILAAGLVAVALLWAFCSARWAGVALAFLGVFVALFRLAPLLPIAEGWVLALSMIGYWFARFTIAIAAGAWAVTTIRPAELIAALRAMRAPNFLVIPLAVVLRTLPTIVHEARAIGDAMTLRGVRPGPRDITLHPLRAGEMLVIPLIMTVVRVGDELAAAALIRGLGSGTRPTSVIELRFRAIDAVPLACAAALIALRVTGWELPW